MQELPSQIDWYKEGGLAAVILILLMVVGWLLIMYRKERERLSDANKEHLKTHAELSKQYACDYKELLERMLLSDHHGNEAIDKMRATLNVIGQLKEIKNGVNYLRDRGDSE